MHIKRKIDGLDFLVIEKHLDLFQTHKRKLLNAVRDSWEEESPANSLTEGRVPVKNLTLVDNNIILRQNRRGGFLQKFIKEEFFYLFGEKRPFSELLMLEKLSAAGCSVPEPFFAVTKSCSPVLYKGFLATFEIASARNLLSVIKSEKERSLELEKICFETGLVAASCIKAGVCHADLHLGNVLLSENDKIFLIDFDKSKKGTVRFNSCSKKLIKRWARSVERNKKYLQGDIDIEKLSTAFAQGLGRA